MPDPLEYAPPRTPWWSTPGVRRLRTAGLVVLSIVCAILTLAGIGEVRSRELFDMTGSFGQLNRYGQEMIDEEAPGTAPSGRRRFITSFDAFYDYVAARRPDIVSRRDAPNPFPGLLTGRRYHRAPGPMTGPDDLLFWSDDVYHRPGGDVRMRMTAEGQTYSLTTHGPAAPPPAR